MPSFADYIRSGSNYFSGGLSESPPAQPPIEHLTKENVTKADFKECLENLRDGKQRTLTPAKQALQNKIEAHTKANLEQSKKQGSEIMPGQFLTGFRQVQFVKTNDYVKPKNWEYKEDMADFEKGIYADSIAFMDTAEKDMPANCDILTLDNVMADRAPSHGKAWDASVPLYGTDGCKNPVFAFLAAHPQMHVLRTSLGETHHEAKSCGKGERAALLAALMMMNAAQLRQQLSALKCKSDVIDRVCNMRELYKSHDAFEKKVAEWADASAHGQKLQCENNDNLGEDLDSLAQTLLAPLGEQKGPMDNSQLLFIFNRLGVTGVIQGQAYEVGEVGEGKKERNFVVSNPELVQHGPKIAEDPAEAQVVKMVEAIKSVPIIVNNGDDGYAIRLSKSGFKNIDDHQEANGQAQREESSQQTNASEDKHFDAREEPDLNQDNVSNDKPTDKQ